MRTNEPLEKRQKAEPVLWIAMALFGRMWIVFLGSSIGVCGADGRRYNKAKQRVYTLSSL